MTTSILGRIEAQIAQEQPRSLCYAYVPGLVLNHDLWVNDTAVLIATPQMRKQIEDQACELHSLFAKVGLHGPSVSSRYDDPLKSSTLVTWSTDASNSEVEMLVLPFVTLNLFFRGDAPLIHGGCAFGTKSSTGEDFWVFATRVLRSQPAAHTPQVESSERPDSYSKLQAELKRFSLALGKAVEADIFFMTAVQLMSVADMKHGEPQQIRTRIIEYSVAMESLLLEQEAELSLRFALRCATLLAGGDEKLDPWNTARNIYKMRSTAVHASKKGESLTAPDVETARLFLYQCMIRYIDLLNSGLTKKDILALLEKALLSGRYAKQLQENTLSLKFFPLIPIEP